MKKAAPKPRKRAGAEAAARTPPSANGAAFADFDDRPLHRCVENALNAYFDALDGENTCGLFDLVMAEVERPMFASVMRSRRRQSEPRGGSARAQPRHAAQETPSVRPAGRLRP